MKTNKIKKYLPNILAVTIAAASSSVLSLELEEVVVTAQKRAQSLQDVPVTVNALDGEALEKYGVDDLFEVANLVPGMVFSRAPDDGLALTLRGLGTPARTQSFDQSVALFLDDMFVGKGRMYSSAFFDVERMEVIKGTQSTLLGKNTSLGAISIVTKKPGDTLAGFVQASREFENGGWGLDGAIDIPVSDTLAIRLAAHAVDQDGWVENLATGNDVPADEDLGFRATAVYTPSEDLAITATYQHSDSERLGNGYQYVDNGGYLPADVLAILGEAKLDDSKTAICPECPFGESHHETTVDSVTVKVEYDAEEIAITSVTSFATYDMTFFDDFDFGSAFDETTYVDNGSVIPYSTFFEREEDYTQFSQEFRLASPGGEKIDYLVGLFYFKSDWDSSEAQHFNTPNFPPPPIPVSGEIFNGTFTNNFEQDTETWSIFGQMTYNFTESLRASLGLRYTDEEKDVVFERVQGDTATLWNSVINPPFNEDLSFSDDFLNGNLNIQYDANEDIALYASYGLGTKTGGFAESAEVSSADPSLDVSLGGAAVKSEEAQTYELGAKMRLLDGTMSLNVALFSTEITDFQETSFLVTDGGAAFLTRNIDVESEGVEVDGQWQVTESLLLSGGVTYADSVNADDGTTLAQAPKWTGSAGFLFERPLSNLGMTFKASSFVRYRDDMVSQINETFPSDSLTTWDLTLGLSDEDGAWEASLIMQNLTNERASDFSGPPAAPIGALFGAPTGDQGITSETLTPSRTIKLQARYNF